MVMFLAPVVGQYFIEIGQEFGLYQKPSARLGAIMHALSLFATQSWVLLTGTFIVGVTGGLWADNILRRLERKKLETMSADSDAPAESMGKLDYIVNGLQSLSDITNIQKTMTKLAISLTRAMTRYTFLINYITNPRIRRTLAARLAKKLSGFATLMRGSAQGMKRAAQMIEESCVPLVEETEIATEADAIALLQFRSVVLSMIEALSAMAVSVSGTQTAVQSLMGISRDMNRAAALLSTATGEFVSEVHIFVERLKRVDETCERKSQLIQAHG